MEKIILCRIAWMKYYQGRANIDIPRSGAKYILENKIGGEIYNFKNQDGKCYGYFPFFDNLNLKNIDEKFDGDIINGVTVVFCATHPSERGMRIVGWYKNATLNKGRKRKQFVNNQYHAVTKFNNAHLIPEDDRVFDLPGTFGRSALFYFSLHPEKEKLLSAIEKYIASNGNPDFENIKSKRKLNAGNAYQQDIEKRLLVEQKAINLAREYYSIRYGGDKNVKSVEQDNKGWDLEVRTDKIRLNIEVKGLSGDVLNVELTPNEFKAFKKCSPNYQLFVANNVLTKNPFIQIFKYQKRGKIWVSNDKSILQISKRTSAVLNLK